MPIKFVHIGLRKQKKFTFQMSEQELIVVLSEDQTAAELLTIR